LKSNDELAEKLGGEEARRSWFLHEALKLISPGDAQ
jgi:hypothetical protein